MKRLLITAALLITVTAVFATARQDTKASMPMTHEMMHAMMNGKMMGNSPLNMQGVDIVVEDTPNGVTVSFTTKTGDIAELRRVSANILR